MVCSFATDSCIRFFVGIQEHNMNCHSFIGGFISVEIVTTPTFLNTQNHSCKSSEIIDTGLTVLQLSHIMPMYSDFNFIDKVPRRLS